ncbi:MAG: exosortase C-terminal domain/associated protein EpsI [Vicinamibacterales bacterium]
MNTRFAIVAALLLSAAVAIGRTSEIEVVPPRSSFATFPTQISAWSGQPSEPFAPDVMKQLAVDDYVNRVYLSSTRPSLGLYIGYYRTQRQGDTMHSPLNCLPGAGWQPVSKTYRAIDVAPGRTIEVNDLVIQKDLDRQVVIYWYQSHGRVVASEYLGRAYMALDAVRLNRTDGAMVRVVVPIDDRAANGEQNATRAALDFSRAMFPSLSRYLPE